MKKSVTQFDLSAAFKALDEMEYPKVEGGILPNRIDLRESFGNRKLRTDVLIEDYYDVNDTNDLEAAADEREAEIAKAKLARIEKIVDLDADSEDDLLTSYEGKVIIQCPQCMTLFYKDEKDLEVDENSPDVVNINETCQHCGNTSGYMVIGKVAPVEEAELDSFDTGDFEEKPEEETEETEEIEEDENIDDLDVLDLDFEEEPEKTKEEETNESLNKAEIQKEVDKKHCSENDSENITLNEDLTEDLDINSYRIVPADYNDNNGYDQEDVEYLLKPGQTKGDLVKALSDFGFISIYVHDGRLATEEEIKQANSLGFETVKELVGDDPADYGDADNFDESLKEDKGEAAKQDELQAEHETPIEEAKKVCEKCGKEICECGKQELKESEIDDIINSVINSWGLNEDINAADNKKLPVGVETAAEQKEKLALIKSLRDHGDKKLADKLRALTLSEIKDLLNKGNKDIDPEEINKTFDNFVKNWGGENNTTTTKTKPAIGITEAVDDDTILINYEDIKKACLDAKKAGKNCPYAGGKYKLFGIDKLYNTIITKEVEAAAIPEKVKTIRDEILANNDDVIGVYVSRVFKNKEDNKTYEVALDKYEKFKPGYEIEVADDEETTEKVESKETTTKKAINESLTEDRKPRYFIQCSDKDGVVHDEFEVLSNNPIAEFKKYVNENGQDFYDITLIDSKDYSIVKRCVNGVINESLTEWINRDFLTTSKMGFKVKNLYQNDKGRLYVVVYRPKSDDYALGAGYDLTTGYWAQGYYDFLNPEDAVDYLFDKYSNENLKKVDPATFLVKETAEVEESLNKAEIQKDVDKKHCAENDSENLTLNEDLAETVEPYEDLLISEKSPVYDWANWTDKDFANDNSYYDNYKKAQKELAQLAIKYAKEGIVPKLSEVDSIAKKYNIGSFVEPILRVLPYLDRDMSLKEEQGEAAKQDEVAEEPVETDVEETEEKEELPEVDFTTSEVKEVATDVAQALSTPVEDEEEAEKQAEEIAEVVDEKVADAVEEKVETEEQTTEEEAPAEEPVADEEAVDETEVIEEPVEEPAELDEALKIIADISDYTPWSGAVDTFNKIKDAGKLDQLEEYLEECYPEGLQMVQLNDILWFDSEDILSYLGLAEDEEDEEDEDFDESLKEADNTSDEVSDAEFDKLVDSKEFDDMLNDPNALAECNINEVFENVDEADEKAFEECITEALCKTYENVKNFTLDECVLKDNKFIVEGTINFNSGKTRKTQYVFESAARAESKAILEGYNKALSEDGNFRINCVLKESCLVPQSMSYKYTIGEHLVEGLATRK